MHTDTKGKEIKGNKYHMIVSRTDTKGIIEYANSNFIEISGYGIAELVGKPHNIVRHPDMPAIVFRLMWQRIQSGQDIFAVVKNMAKNGDYYWVTTKFEIKKHPFTNQVNGYVAYRQGAPEHVVDTMSKIYVDLLAIEKTNGMDASEKYLLEFLASKNMTYDQYIEYLTGSSSIFKSLLSKMANLFH